MSKSHKQTQFGSTKVVKHNGKIPCDCEVSSPEDSERKICGNTAVIAIENRDVGTRFFCRIHAKETWLRMAGVEVR